MEWNIPLLCGGSHASLFAGIQSRWHFRKRECRIAGKPARLTAFHTAGRNTGLHENYPVVIQSCRTTGKQAIGIADVKAGMPERQIARMTAGTISGLPDNMQG